MSALPEGWAEVELGEVWHESRARARPDAIARIGYIGLEHVEGGTNRITGAGRSDGVKSAVAVFSAGDILYGRLRPYLNKVIQPSFAGVASTEFLVFKETQALVNGLLMHLLSSSDLVAYASANSAGVNLPRISAKRLAEYRFPLAPLPEQHRIVAKIESLFAKLDEGVAALKRAEASLERYRASVLQAAIEGRLTEHWRSENPPEETGKELLGRILTERRKRWEAEQLANFKAKGRKPPRNWRAKYKEPVAPDTSGLPELPEGWCWATVDQVSAVTGGLTKNPARSRLPIRYPYLRVANVYADELRLDDVKTIGVSESELDRVLVRSGDLLVVEGNGSADQIGRVAQWQGDLEPCCHQNHLIKVRRTSSACRSRWMLLWLLSPLGRRTVLAVASSTSGLHTLSLSKVRALPVPLVPVREQARAVDLAASLSDAARVAQEQIEAETLVRAAALRQSILKRAFEGGLVPQDPADEPVSGLLHRIRAGREAAQTASIHHDQHQDSPTSPRTTDSTSGDHLP